MTCDHNQKDFSLLTTLSPIWIALTVESCSKIILNKALKLDSNKGRVSIQDRLFDDGNIHDDPITFTLQMGTTKDSVTNGRRASSEPCFPGPILSLLERNITEGSPSVDVKFIAFSQRGKRTTVEDSDPTFTVVNPLPLYANYTVLAAVSEYFRSRELRLKYLMPLLKIL